MTDSQIPQGQAPNPPSRYQRKSVGMKRNDMIVLRAQAEELIKRIDRCQRLRDWALVNGNQSTAALQRQSHEVTQALLEYRRSKFKVEDNVIEMPTPPGAG